MKNRTSFSFLILAAAAAAAAVVNGTLHVSGALSAGSADFRNATSVKLLPFRTAPSQPCSPAEFSILSSGGSHWLQGCSSSGAFATVVGGSSEQLDAAQSWVSNPYSGTIRSEMTGNPGLGPSYIPLILDGLGNMQPLASNVSTTAQCSVSTEREPVPGCAEIGTSAASANVNTNYYRYLFILQSQQPFSSVVSWMIRFRMYGPSSPTSTAYARIGATTDPNQASTMYGLRFYGSSVRAEANGTLSTLSSVNIANQWSEFSISHDKNQPGRVEIRHNGNLAATICPAGGSCTLSMDVPSAQAWYFVVGGFSGSSPATVRIPYDWIELKVE